MQMNNDKVRSPDNELPLVIFHWSLVIFFLCALSGREKKCIAGFQPAKVVLTQKELSRLRCRRDAGATIFSHDPCVRGRKWVRIRHRGAATARSIFFGHNHSHLRPWMNGCKMLLHGRESIERRSGVRAHSPGAGSRVSFAKPGHSAHPPLRSARTHHRRTVSRSQSPAPATFPPLKKSRGQR